MNYGNTINVHQLIVDNTIFNVLQLIINHDTMINVYLSITIHDITM